MRMRKRETSFFHSASLTCSFTHFFCTMTSHHLGGDWGEIVAMTSLLFESRLRSFLHSFSPFCTPFFHSSHLIHSGLLLASSSSWFALDVALIVDVIATRQLSLSPPRTVKRDARDDLQLSPREFPHWALFCIIPNLLHTGTFVAIAKAVTFIYHLWILS